MPTKLEYELEDILDQTSLTGLLEMLESICYSKAEHLATNWQDQPASQAWARAGLIIGTASHRKSVMVVS